MRQTATSLQNQIIEHIRKTSNVSKLKQYAAAILEEPENRKVWGIDQDVLHDRLVKAKSQVATGDYVTGDQVLAELDEMIKEHNPEAE